MRPLPPVTLAVLAALAACAEAGGETKGGALTDAGLAATNPPRYTPDTSAAPADGACSGTGTKWSDLYNDIFGPTGRPGSCAFAASCHGTPDGAGAKIGGGVQCFDEKGCRQSFFDKGLVDASDSAAPEKAALFGVLRIRTPEGSPAGTMPEIPADYVFSDTCVERMKTWIRDGAKDD